MFLKDNIVLIEKWKERKRLTLNLSFGDRFRNQRIFLTWVWVTQSICIVILVGNKKKKWPLNKSENIPHAFKFKYLISILQNDVGNLWRWITREKDEVKNWEC